MRRASAELVESEARFAPATSFLPSDRSLLVTYSSPVKLTTTALEELLRYATTLQRRGLPPFPKNCIIGVGSILHGNNGLQNGKAHH